MACCQLVGDLQLGIDGCIISINTSCSTEGIIACGDEVPLPGPTTGTINITAYATDEPWIGCPARAGVSIPYLRKYDCENDIVYFIPNGQGQSYVTGDVQGLARVKYPLSTCIGLSASATGGPASIYMQDETTTGYGFIYSGRPIAVETDKEMAPINIGFGPAELYLQSITFEAQPAQIPTVSYSFVFGGEA